MLFFAIVQDYFRWHYSRAFREIFHVWLNFLWFLVHFFSLPQLARSLFMPWRRITEQRQKGWNLENLASYVIINLMSRLVGALIRSAIIIVGLLSLATVIVLGIATYLFWLAAPVFIVACFGIGVSLLVFYTLV